MASRMAPKLPIAAASDGVARPARMAPSTQAISAARGKKLVISAQATSAPEPAAMWSGSLGAMAGRSIARPIT